MTSKSLVFVLCSALVQLGLWGQQIEGYVYDAKTNTPLETVAVYFDNTTIGTTTDANGYFELEYNEAIKSTLVFSYLGYEIVYENNYREKSQLKVFLKESVNELETVVLDYDDGLTRAQKLKLFKKEFLGVSKYAKSCDILNEEDLILRYRKSDRVLTASSKKPIVFEHKKFGYTVYYDLRDFETKFRYANLKTQEFVVSSVLFQGTSYFEDFKEITNSHIRNRNKAYLGSVQHFMRSLYEDKLANEDFVIFKNGFKTDAWRYIKVTAIEDSDLKQVGIAVRLSVLFDGKHQSDIVPKYESFTVDNYGNFAPIEAISFSGYMGMQRAGDVLPSNFQPKK
jgi:hypothetical protein